jgi:hypothetical protein
MTTIFPVPVPPSGSPPASSASASAQTAPQGIGATQPAGSQQDGGDPAIAAIASREHSYEGSGRSPEPLNNVAAIVQLLGST